MPIQRAILNLEQLQSIAAKLNYRVFLFDKELLGAGEYYQQRKEAAGPDAALDRLGCGHYLRFELKTAVADGLSTYVQVCDDGYLWISEQTAGRKSLGRIDLVQVAKAVRNHETASPQNLEDMLRWPGLGGLPKLLRGLYANFTFTTVERVNMVGSHPALRIEGEWKREHLSVLLPDQKAAVEKGGSYNLERLPPYLPHTVVLYLSEDRLFPHRIEYHRKETSRIRRGEAPRDVEILRLEIPPDDVLLNVAIPPAKFTFAQPKGEVPDDLTNSFLESLGLKKKK